MATKQIKAKTKDREATEERLLIAAEQVFSKFGFKGATTRMIAKKADINLALINRYFDGKYGLLLKVLEKKKQQMHGALPYPVQDNLVDECVEFAKYRFDAMSGDVHFFKIIMVQFLTDPKFLKKFQESLIDFETIPGFEERLDNLNKKGKIPNYESAYKIFDVINGYICAQVLFELAIFKERDAKELRAAVEEFTRTYCQGLLA